MSGNLQKGDHSKGRIYAISRPVTFISLSVLSFLTRYFKLDEPDHVCWDETHFGKMGSYYINRTFFFDVHPPLGKMLIGLAGSLSGYDGSFTFEAPGEKYENVNYMGMRILCATLGSLVIPLIYLTVLELSQSVAAASLASLFVLFDTGTLTLSQYILLDPILLFFIIAALFALVKFQSLSLKPFQVLWWFWMVMTGLFLACAFSVKWVGLFVILYAGAYTAWDIWRLLADLTLSKMILMKHFLARVLCLIIFPVLVYIAFFAVHFYTLNKSGPGDGFFSSGFQSKLIGNRLHNVSMPEKIAYGSVITLKNHRAAGGLLHSHPHLYPEGIGAQQQQVTAYAYKDENNLWLIKKYVEEDTPVGQHDHVNVEFVRNGDFVLLEHVMTQRNLHSHELSAPLTRNHHQVTCYGENGTGDVNDVWQVEVPGAPEGAIIKVVQTKLKLIHVLTGCALFSHSRTLPAWGWEQLEVTCNPYNRDQRTLWNVEDHLNPRLPNISFEVFRSSFLDSLIESHIVMAQGNSDLKPKEGEVTSQPWQWPINFRGQRFSGYNNTEVRIYLLGNPVIWWGNLLVLMLFPVALFIWLVRRERGLEEDVRLKNLNESAFTSCSWLFFGWCLHYLPFFMMGRVLYFHHYFPAYLFNCMLSGILINHSLVLLDCHLLPNREGALYSSGLVVISAITLQSYYIFHPLSYGMVGPLADEANSTLTGLKWLESWEI
ncbi:Protein O-mannosyl-transferase 2 [Holothuria leucospilota]|uniref:Protein O-mannosyl-transferase 2 n=1 Tax=Holothuria leucospilota TaxID=206669 RepID=A0A9Q1CJB9_HOLLE|nr:Protein O-mannosyl-transferase 2 [Holothuria leucospilota]